MAYTEWKNAGKELKFVANINASPEPQNINCTGVVGWKNLTVNDFLLGFNNVTLEIPNQKITLSEYPVRITAYNSSTGVLTVSTSQWKVPSNYNILIYLILYALV